MLQPNNAPATMDYEWDVFLSYLHERPSGAWVNDHLLPYFRPALGNALNRKAQVFYDRAGIHTGQKWPARLKQALSRSRCLVCIWSPPYFQSEWCLSECAVMRYRESQLGYGTAQKPDGLLIGIKVDDGDYFPKYATDSQYADFERFFYDGPAFLQSPLHMEFQKEIRTLGVDVARIVKAVPPWSAEWETDQWLENIVGQVQKPGPPKVNQPLIV